MRRAVSPGAGAAIIASVGRFDDIDRTFAVLSLFLLAVTVAGYAMIAVVFG